MRTTDSVTSDAITAIARQVTEREMRLYGERTRASQVATDRARKVLPAGVPSSFQAYDPHPIVVRHASGSRMIDVDGNEYVDYDMGFGALFAGHMHPAVRRAVEAQLDHGTLYVTPCELDAEVGELLADRYGLPMWRPTAPVNEPFSWPKNSDSMSSRGIAAEFTTTNGPTAAVPGLGSELKWIARAISSLPVPDSPWIATVRLPRSVFLTSR